MDTQTWQLDDEVDAVNLQLGYLHIYDDEKKGKYSSSNIPDPEVAYDDFRTYLQLRLQFLQDFELAHSIANAVSSDAPVIAKLIEAERAAHEDRQLAFQMSNEEPDLEAPSPYTEVGHEVAILDDLLSHLDIQDEEPVDAGPSGYVKGQVETLEKLAGKSFQCSACIEQFRFTETSELLCGDRYCGGCLKDFVMRPVRDHDLTLLPARCCRHPVPQSVVATVLNEQEYEAYQYAEEEAATRDKTYCSSATCGHFVSPKHVVAETATCPQCRVGTCSICKNIAHKGDCPADLALQVTLALGIENNWQRCFSCRALVAIEWGCNHMSCRCEAQFCYQCGIEWNQCRCELWHEETLVQRAEQIVARDAAPNIAPDERQRRVVQIQNQLRDTDECEHPGKFQKITDRGRFRCDWCNDTHRKFILQCRHCHLELCNDCRSHRV